jgi:hypothetical protein
MAIVGFLPTIVSRVDDYGIDTRTFRSRDAIACGST